MRHQERHRQHEEHLRRYWLAHHLNHPRGIRHYIGAHMHRRIFMWFGASIFFTTGIMMVVHRVFGTGPVRFLGFFMVAVVIWMLAGKIARRIARPLSELVYVAQEIGAGRLRARATVTPWNGEIAILSRAINDMAVRIEKQINDQRELLAGVSHEIRTPLARIRLLLEIGRQSGVKPATLDELEREVIEIDTLVGELLASARLDFAALSPRPLDGAEAARRALERAGLPAGLLVVAPESEGALGFEADATLVARALANLLDNARRHGGGVSALRVAVRDGLVTFEVEDRGPGFPADDKSAPRAEGSLGLGLVLVRRIADAHHGSLTLTNRAEGGARATIAFPCPLAAEA
jgi:signal transduction histidine kinase